MNLTDALTAARKNLVGFRAGVLSCPGDVAPAPFHRTIGRIALAGANHAAITAFRESGKTEYLVRALPVHRLVFGAGEYIVIIRASSRLAEKALADITEAVSAHPLLSRLVRFTRKTAGAVEATGLAGSVRIEAFGKGASLRGLSHRGLRPSLIIIDDAQDAADMVSKTATARDWAWFMSDVFFLSATGRIIAIGNTLGRDCLMERLFSAADELNFSTVRIPVMDADGNSAWPQKFSADRLEKLKKAAEATGTAAAFAREMLCLAVTDGSMPFSGASLPAAAEPENAAVFAAVDVAIGQGEKHDRSAIAVIAVGPDNTVTILDIRAGRWNPSELIDEIFAAAERYRPAAIAIESVAWQAALVHLVMRRMPTENTFFRVIPVTPRGAKVLRITGLIEPRLATNTIAAVHGAWTADFMDELTRFPHAPHDDMLDALAHALAIAEPPAAKRDPLPAYSAM